MWFGRGGYIFSSKFFSEKAKNLGMCPSIGGNMGETWLRRGPIITPPYRKVNKNELKLLKRIYFL